MNIFKWLYLKYRLFAYYLGVSMYNLDMETLRSPTLDVDEKKKFVQRKRHRSQLLEKFYQGQTDEKYVKDYYELLKKGDEYLRNADSHKMDLTADKWGMSYGRVDPITNRKYEHLGFFDDKNKNSGRTLGEVINEEILVRSTGDDDYPLKYIIDNRKIVIGLTESLEIIEKYGGNLKDHNKRPVFANRKNESQQNKIEQIADFVHIKKIGMEHIFIEFFIPRKYKLENYDVESQVFNEIINVDTIWWYDKYGKLYGFKIDSYVKRFFYKEYYEIIKFQGTEIETKNET